jgi:hypothetical protein
MSARGLLRYARLTRRQLISFAVLSTILNGAVTASVGTWLARTYSAHEARRQSVEGIANLMYGRRTRAGMVASALRRNADVEEVRFRKRAYDEAYVEWNTRIWHSIFGIREAAGQVDLTKLEEEFQDKLVAAMADVDRCLTAAYDKRLANQDPKPVLDDCRISGLQQFVLDCGSTFTDELFKLTSLTFSPFASRLEERTAAEEKVRASCTRPPESLPKPPDAPAAAAPPATTPAATTPPAAAAPAASR